jgi:galactokinase/mevalonate kinase-like predicted kinase
MQKKNVSYIITSNQVIKNIDKVLEENNTVLAHRLCGAGNGGFFLTFSRKGQLNIPFNCVKIDVETNGVTGKEL